MPVAVVQGNRSRRIRANTDGFRGLPDLRPLQHALLRRWLAAHARGRKWQGLLEIAGRDQLEQADELRDLLLEAGALSVTEHFAGGQWQVERIGWADVAALQAALGLHSAADRDAARDAVQLALRVLADTHAWTVPAVQSCQPPGLSLTTLQARQGLLEALVAWQQEQRFGTRRDFALQARGLTKGVTPAEWDWLSAHLPLEDLGIARFAPLLWLGGSLRLETPAGRVDVGALGFCALPMHVLPQAGVPTAPQRYWLIENRASFERQAMQAAAGTCVMWLPGQPPSEWLAAVGHLLDRAPAAALVSCDPDPAGMSIALHAGALWSARGLPWQPHRMALSDWQHKPTSALNGFDLARLTQLEARGDLPEALRMLCDDLRRTGRKAEQEGWL